MNQDEFNILFNLTLSGLSRSLINLISNLLVKLLKENKTTFLLHDFNIEILKYLLKYYHSTTNKFFNSISCLTMYNQQEKEL